MTAPSNSTGVWTRTGRVVVCLLLAFLLLLALALVHPLSAVHAGPLR